MDVITLGGIMKNFIICLLLLSAFVVSGCESLSNIKKLMPQKIDENASSTSSGFVSASKERELNLEIEDAEIEKKQIGQQDMKRKVIYSSSLQIEVQNVLKSIDQIKGIVKLNKGYIESSSVRKDESTNWYGEIIVRVPPVSLEKSMSDLKKIGEVLNESIKGEEVTKYYYDVQARLKNAQKFEARLLKLLETKTSRVKDVLDIETELARVRGNIEELQGTVKYYNNLIDLATIQVTLYEKGVISKRVNILQPIIDTIGAAFAAFFSSIGSIIIIVFALAPWIAFIAVLVFFGLVLLKRIKK